MRVHGFSFLQFLKTGKEIKKASTLWKLTRNWKYTVGELCYISGYNVSPMKYTVGELCYISRYNVSPMKYTVGKLDYISGYNSHQ